MEISDSSPPPSAALLYLGPLVLLRLDELQDRLVVALLSLEELDLVLDEPGVLDELEQRVRVVLGLLVLQVLAEFPVVGDDLRVLELDLVRGGSLRVLAEQELDVRERETGVEPLLLNAAEN